MGPWLIPLATALISSLGGHLLNKYDKAGGPGSGTPEKFGKIKTSTPEQEKFAKNLFKTGGGLNQNPLYQQGQDYLSGILSGDPEAMKAFEAPYLQNFSENILPEISNRFASFGTGAGGLNSSGFQQTLAQAGRGLQTDLAQMRAGLQQNAANQGLQYAQQPINNLLNALNFKPFETTHTQRQPGATDTLAGALPGIVKGGFDSYQQYQNQKTQNQQSLNNSLNSLNNMKNSVYGAT